MPAADSGPCVATATCHRGASQAICAATPVSGSRTSALFTFSGASSASASAADSGSSGYPA
ncbi:hypothetical protein GCM10009544_03590 [Streptomyces stramineus]|uniref:DUF1540 domain-containing protein n=1 Tax=Streptomyces stramineus TaxID=173861 RepID=A0ABN0ZD98_9ACTN